jgi:hypothetical protein
MALSSLTGCSRPVDPACIYHMPFGNDKIITEFPVENAERDANRIFREHGFGLIMLVNNQGLYSSPTTHDYAIFSGKSNLYMLDMLTTTVSVDSQYDVWLAQGQDAAWKESEQWNEQRHDFLCFNKSAYTYAIRFNDRMMNLIGAKPDPFTAPRW